MSQREAQGKRNNIPASAVAPIPNGPATTAKSVPRVALWVKNDSSAFCVLITTVEQWEVYRNVNDISDRTGGMRYGCTVRTYELHRRCLHRARTLWTSYSDLSSLVRTMLHITHERIVSDDETPKQNKPEGVTKTYNHPAT